MGQKSNDIPKLANDGLKSGTDSDIHCAEEADDVFQETSTRSSSYSGIRQPGQEFENIRTVHASGQELKKSADDMETSYRNFQAEDPGQELQKSADDMEKSYRNVEAEEPGQELQESDDDLETSYDIPKLANVGEKRSRHQHVESNLEEPKRQKLLPQTSQISNQSQDLMNGWDDGFGNYDPPEADAYENHGEPAAKVIALDQYIVRAEEMLAEARLSMSPINNEQYENCLLYTSPSPRD